jgi:hypothetical protein
MFSKIKFFEFNTSSVTFLYRVRVLESTQPYINVCKHFQLISEMSENDLKTLGHSVGFSPVLDNPRAARYNPTQAGAATHSGNGLCNNRPFSSTC